MIRRIDLRGADLDALDLRDGAAPCRARRRGGPGHGAADLRGRPRRGARRRCSTWASGSTASGLPALRVPAPALARRARAGSTPDVRAALEESIRRARTRARRTSGGPTPSPRSSPAARSRERWVPVERVGLYVPGGRAVYPSSVVMNVVPAQVAGVASIAVARPPQKDFGGLPHPTILAACALLGVDEVYAVGGAQAIAMFAYGTEGPDACRPTSWSPAPATSTSPRPSGCSRAASASTPRPARPRSRSSPTTPPTPRIVAADLISQAEHDPSPPSVLVTDSVRLADCGRGRARAAGRRDEARRADRRRRWPGQQSAIVLVDDLDAGLRVVDAYAAEHLEIQTARRRRRRDAGPQRGRHLRRRLRPGLPRRLRRRFQPRAAHRRMRLPLQGAVGAVLPPRHPRRRLRRGGAARRRAAVVALANAEDLPAHGAAVDVRFPAD